MNTIPLIRANHLTPFVSVLKQIDAPIGKLLSQAKLPENIFTEPNKLVPELRVWNFLYLLFHLENIVEFGRQLGKNTNLVYNNAAGEKLCQALDISSALNKFCRLVSSHNTEANFRLITDDNNAWFCKRGIRSAASGHSHVEQQTVIFMILLVRMITGSSYRPCIVHLKSNSLPGVEGCKILAGSKIHISQAVTAISIPKILFNKPLLNRSSARVDQNSKSHNVSHGLNEPQNFTSSLTKVINSYSNFCDSFFDIETISEIIGIKPRTLQRRLAQEGKTYSRLIDEIRFTTAIPLLKETDIKLIDIAFDLGYSDPAHFTRAFHRWMGISPSSYRTQYCIN